MTSAWGNILLYKTSAGWQAGVTLSLTWSRAENPAHSALISGFEHLLGIIMEKLDFKKHFSIFSPKLCFFSWIQAEFRMKYALPTRLRCESLYSDTFPLNL